MTEKDVYKNGVALLEEWEDVNYCEHSFKFKGKYLSDKEVVDTLNDLHEERISKDNRIKRLEEKIQRERTSFTKQHLKWSKEAETKIKELQNENEQLKKENKGIQDKVWKLLELLEKENGIDKMKIIDWWNGDVE